MNAASLPEGLTQALRPARRRRRRAGRGDDGRSRCRRSLLDLLITLNISAALVIVVATLYVPRALDFSSFPTLLLLTTLFRLAINVSVTRLILLHGDAGHVVDAFGNFVVGGNVVVGLVIFLILVVIQFVVDHQRRRPRGRGRRALHPRRHAGQADGDRRRPQRRPDHRRAGARAPRRDRPRGRLLRRDGRRLEVRQGRRHGRHPDHADQPDRRHRRRRPAAGHAVRRGGAALLAAHGRRRPVRADPGAADLGRDRHHRHALGLREGPRHRHRRPDPRPAQGAAGRGRRDLRVRARPGPAEAPVPADRRPASSPSAGRCARAAAEHGRAEPRDEARRPRRRRRRASCPPRATPRSTRSRSTRSSWRSASASCRSSTQHAGGTLLRASARSAARSPPSSAWSSRPSASTTTSALDSHEYVVQGARHRGRARAVMAGHQLAMDPGDAVGQLSTACPRPSPRSACPPCGSPRRSRAEAEALGYTVVDAESVIVTHLTETIRAHAADLLDPPGDAPAARPAQGTQRRGR